MKDGLISRRAAIEAVRKDIMNYTDTSDTVKYSICKMSDITLKTVANRIKRLPTVDAVEVVRCRDCKYYDSDAERCDGDDYQTRPDAFCSYAERRDG